MRSTSGISERLTDLRRVGGPPPENLLTLDGQRYMTPAEAWTQLRIDIRGFLELQRAGRMLEHPESRAEHQRVSRDALRRLGGRCALFLHWYRANPGVALVAWDRTVQRMIEALAELLNSGEVTPSTQDALRAGMALFAEERELMPRLSPSRATELASREARIGDQAEALLRGTGGFGMTPKASEQVQALSRPFALWQTPETLAADLIARMVAGVNLGQAITRAGRKRMQGSVPLPPASTRPAPREPGHDSQPTREQLPARERAVAHRRMGLRDPVPAYETRSLHARMPAAVDSVDPVIHWTIEQGGLRPDELTTVDEYTFNRLLSFRGLLSQEGHLFAALGEHWMKEQGAEVSGAHNPGAFFRELFFFMLAESRAEGALRSGVETVDPVVIGVILRGGLRPEVLDVLSEEEQQKVRRIPALVSEQGLTWLEHARAHYEGIDVHEDLDGLPLDAVTVNDFIEVFRYGLDYSVVEFEESLSARGSRAPSAPARTSRTQPPPRRSERLPSATQATSELELSLRLAYLDEDLPPRSFTWGRPRWWNHALQAQVEGLVAIEVDGWAPLEGRLAIGYLTTSFDHFPAGTLVVRSDVPWREDSRLWLVSHLDRTTRTWLPLVWEEKRDEKSREGHIPRGTADLVQAATGKLATVRFVLTWPGTAEQPHYVPGATLLEENDFAPEEILELAALEPGQAIYFGGGAWQRVEVRRLGEDEALRAVRRGGRNDERRPAARLPLPPSARGASERCPASCPARFGVTLERCPAPGVARTGSSCGCTAVEQRERCPAPRNLQKRR